MDTDKFVNMGDEDYEKQEFNQKYFICYMYYYGFNVCYLLSENGAGGCCKA
ncbi:hypothetical protein [Blautia sp. HCP3S3_C4]|uniref:hypothetical protein n=1 Tax=Blautia sp. HCP3S3_C4 TaxID=3438911 RepID=UPI003F8B1B5F